MENMQNLQGPYKSAMRLKDCQLEKEALEKQVEELKMQLQISENHISCLEEKLQQTDLEEQGVRDQPLQNQEEDSTEETKSRRQEEDVRLQGELEETRRELAYEKHLKEKYFQKEKETRAELERLRGFTDPQASKLASKVRANIRRKPKKMLQREFEELKVFHISMVESLKAQCQDLQQKLDVSYPRIRDQLEEEQEKSKEVEEQLKTKSEDLLKLQAELENMTLKQSQTEAQLHLKEEEIKTLQKHISDKLKELREKMSHLEVEQERVTQSIQTPDQEEVLQTLDASGIPDLERNIKKMMKKQLQKEFEKLRMSLGNSADTKTHHQLLLASNDCILRHDDLLLSGCKRDRELLQLRQDVRTLKGDALKQKEELRKLKEKLKRLERTNEEGIQAARGSGLNTSRETPSMLD
ncbi:trichohyalin-like [Notolabrus celidotus]|uniref:trichohyalin-like n=1 Tax=Notolabrus celidotus TaxID=1203425 RepID=UPI00148FAB82|nr:trichohyalin-like [Notolabrus celidotus]